MEKRTTNPRILIVTPEVTYLPEGMGNLSNYLSAKAGGMADVSSVLISALFDQGADVHVALPDFRGIFRNQLAPILGKEMDFIRNKMPGERVHLAEDRAFFYQHHVYSDYEDQNIKVALAFQREVINNIIPRVQPDLIHCNDWMTGLLPGVSRRLNIPCLFTLHNIHTKKMQRRGNRGPGHRPGRVLAEPVFSRIIPTITSRSETPTRWISSPAACSRPILSTRSAPRFWMK